MSGGGSNPVENAVTSVQDTVKSVVANPAQGVAQLAKTSVGATIQGTVGALGQIPGAQKYLKDPTLNRLTFGTASDYADTSATGNALVKGQTPTDNQIQGAERFAIKGTAIAAGGAEIAGAEPGTYTATQGLTAFGVGQSLQSGNIAGAVDLAGGGDYLNNIIPGAGDALNGLLPTGAKYSAPTASRSLTPATYSVGSSSPNAPAISPVAIAALIGIVVLAKAKVA